MDKFNTVISPLINEIASLTEQLADAKAEVDANGRVAEELGAMLQEAYERIDELTCKEDTVPTAPTVPVQDTVDSIIAQSLIGLDSGDILLSPVELMQLAEFKRIWQQVA